MEIYGMGNGQGYDNRGNKEYEIKNGKGYIKEYDNEGKFIFEGEYLNGERNGIGKEYFLIKENSNYSNPDNIILKFEGEYLNGQRHGKGKEYYENKNLKFEGEYLNGKKHGKGKEYFSGGLTIEFEYLDGKRTIGKEFRNDKLIYIGEYLGGDDLEYEEYNPPRRIGKGREYENDKLIFEGEYLYGLKNGIGKEYIDNQLVFEGEYINGKKNGKGKEYYFKYHNLKYEGEYLNDKRHGYGKEYKFGELIFEGEYSKGVRIEFTNILSQ